MNKKQADDSWGLKWIIVIAVVAVITAVGINFYLGYQELEQIDQKIVNLKQDIKQLKKEKQKLQTELKQVHSKQFIKRMARKKLGLVKNGEILYITVEKE